MLHDVNTKKIQVNIKGNHPKNVSILIKWVTY